MALENHACFVPQELILAILNHLRNFFTRAFSPLMRGENRYVKIRDKNFTKSAKMIRALAFGRRQDRPSLSLCTYLSNKKVKSHPPQSS